MLSKQKAIIFSSRGGAAHQSAAEVIKQDLENLGFDVIISNILTDVLNKLDPINYISKYGAENFYNYLLKSGWYWSVNQLADFGIRRLKVQHDKVVKLITEFLKQEKADLVVSVMPIINSQVSDAAKQINIPFIVVTVDFDLSYYFSIKPDYENLFITLPSNDAINLKNFPDKNIFVAGFPIRKSFFECKDREKIKKEFNIPDKSVILIMMGGTGSKRAFYFVKKLSASKNPLHLIVCLGRNEFLKKKIENLKLPKNISVSCLGFTDKIADLMSISDLLITKAGPTSLVEAITMKLPILIDGTSTFLNWEKINAQLVQKYKIGEIIKNYGYTLKQSEKLLFDTEYRNQILGNLENLKLPNFNQLFPSLANLIIFQKSI